MKRKLGRRRPSNRKLFDLQQILPMRPYVFCLMNDLRILRRRLDSVRKTAETPRILEKSYDLRRQRHEAVAELNRLRDEEQTLIREFKKLSIRIGNVQRGEMLFACLVDHRDAYFVWYDGEPRPTHWRFRGDADLRLIPDRWFAMHTSETTHRRIDDRR